MPATLGASYFPTFHDIDFLSSFLFLLPMILISGVSSLVESLPLGEHKMGYFVL